MRNKARRSPASAPIRELIDRVGRPVVDALPLATTGIALVTLAQGRFSRLDSLGMPELGVVLLLMSGVASSCSRRFKRMLSGSPLHLRDHLSSARPCSPVPLFW